jgi:hypothetical protein
VDSNLKMFRELWVRSVWLSKFELPAVVENCTWVILRQEVGHPHLLHVDLRRVASFIDNVSYKFFSTSNCFFTSEHEFLGRTTSPGRKFGAGST